MSSMLLGIDAVGSARQTSPSGSPSATRAQDRHALESKPGSSPDVDSTATTEEALNAPVQPTYSAPAAYNRGSGDSTDAEADSSQPQMTGNLAILMLSVLRRAGSQYEEATAAKPVLDIRA